MEQKYIINDIVLYNNKIMVIKEPIDGIHFDLYCPKEGLIYCFVDVSEIKPVRLTIAILEKNGWNKRTKVCYDGEHLESFNNPSFPLEHFAIVFTEKGIRVTYDCLPVREIKYVSDLQHLLFGLNINHEMEV